MSIDNLSRHELEAIKQSVADEIFGRADADIAPTRSKADQFSEEAARIRANLRGPEGPAGMSAEEVCSRLPSQAAARKAVPIVSGCLDYFPDALAAVAALSLVGNEQHNPGEPLHWARGKSTDEADCILRHLMDRGTFDTDGVRHSVKVAWRALALLQKELEEANGLPISRGSWPAT